MKKITCFLLSVVLFACKGKEKFSSSDENKDTEMLIANPSSDSLGLSRLAKEKIRQAFSLIQQYARETKVMPRPAADAYVFRYSRVVFGKLKNSFLEIEGGKSENNELLIVFEADLPLAPQMYGVCQYLDDGRVLIAMNPTNAESLSVPIIASVIFHEMAHLEFRMQNIYQQIDEKTQAMNEGAAYLRQVSFLVWSYGGANQEAQYSLTRQIEGSFPALPIPSNDWPHFSNFYDKEQEMSKIILR